MKTSKIILWIIILICLSASAIYAQQQFTQTVTAKNRSCNSTCSVLDIEDSVNPALIIFVTPVLVNGVNLNPHPVGAYYMYQNKWSIFNLDGTAMTVGAKFNVEYYEKPDPNHFVYVVPQPGPVSYIDHAGLNNNPNARIQVSPTSPRSGGALFNRDEIKIEYDTSALKWSITNINNKPLLAGTAYNIVVTSGISNSPKVSAIIPELIVKPTVNSTPDPTCNCDIPTSLPPNGSAGGDLSGTYPYPIVNGLQGKPISSIAPTIGQTLRWNGSEWTPATDATATPTTTPTPAAAAPAIQTYFKNATTGGYHNLTDQTPFLMPELTHVVTLDKRSRMIISGMMDIAGPNCPLGCGGTTVTLQVHINGAAKFGIGMGADNYAKSTATISNFMIDLDPGTYTVTFVVIRSFNVGLAQIYGKQSSIMIIPL